MKKIVSLGLLVLLVGANIPATMHAKQDGVLKNGARTVGSALRYAFFTTPVNACKAGGKALSQVAMAGKDVTLHVGAAGVHVAMAAGKATKHITFAALRSSKFVMRAAICATILGAICWGIEPAVQWAFGLGLPQLLGCESTFRELVVVWYNYFAPIITSNASSMINTLKNTKYLETIKSIPAFIKAVPGILYAFCRQMPQAFKKACGCTQHLKLMSYVCE